MPESTMTRSVGLFTSDKIPVPLAGVSIEADLSGFYAKVVVAHRYVNHEDTAIEAVYVFPLDEGAAVCGFEAVVDGTLVVGEIHERDRAFEIYDDAMEAGHGAFLLDEERPDVFQASVGNLAPGREVTVRLTYVTELTIEEGRLRFAIPTTVSPRYASAADRVATGRSDAEALNPPVAETVPYGLNLSVRARMPRGITAIESPSHPITVRIDDAGATVSLARQDAALDRDVVLSIEAPGLDAPHALLDRDGDGAETVGVAFAPAFTASSAPAELVFLVDRSGSMAGDSIAEVRNALQLCLRSMTSGCRFNIVGFGSSHVALFPGSSAYEQATLEAASAHVAAMEADLGGTELLPALRSVLEQHGFGELPRQIVVLTDGEVTNTDGVIELAARHASSARIFTFGIGAGASHHLVRGLARAGGGTAEFIYPGERIEPKVLRQLARLLSPALTDVRVEWVGGTVTQAPVRIPPVFAGGRLLVYGFVKERRPALARLTANSPSGPLSFDVPVPDAADGSGSTVATLAARARIRELEEGSEWLSSRGSRQTERKAGGARNEIIALSLRYGLMSRETSFVAIERRDTPVAGEVMLRKVPIALTTGWGGLHHPLTALRRQLAWSTPTGFGGAPRAVRPGSVPGAPLGLWRVRDGASAPGWSDDDDASDTGPVMPAMSLRDASQRSRSAPAPSGVHALIRLQAADGSWDLTGELAVILGRELSKLTAATKGARGAQAEIRRAWATALALVWIAREAADLEPEWRLLAGKARNWIDWTAAVAPEGRDWIEEAEAFLEH